MAEVLKPSRWKKVFWQVQPKVKDIVERVRENPRLARWVVNIGALLIIYWVVQGLVAWLAQPRLVDIMTMSPLAGRLAVAAKPVEQAEIVHRVTYTGSVVPYLDSEIRSRAQGWVQEVLIDEQNFVRKDQVLVRLDLREVGAKREQAKADLAFWEAEYQRIKKLFSEKAVSQFDWDNAQRQYAAAQSMAAQAEAMYSYGEIRAPFAGWIAERTVDPGTMVNPGTKLLRLVDLHQIRVQVKVAEADLEHLAVGNEVNVRFSSLGEAQANRRGKVTTVFPQLDPMTRTATVEIILDNPNALVRPDMYAVVDLILERHQEALIVPRRCLVEVGGKPTVFVTDGVSATARTVQTGIADGDRLEILSGVQPGEMVIYRGNRALVDGQQVNLVETPEETDQKTVTQRTNSN